MVKKLILIILISLALFGCVPAIPPVVDHHLRPGIDLRRYERIAVLSFSPPSGETSAGIYASDIVGLELMKKGYIVVERARVDQVLREQGLGLTGVIDELTAVEIGKILGVQAIVVGSVGNYKIDRQMMGGGFFGPMLIITSYASVTMKMIDLRDASVVWASQGSSDAPGSNPTVPLRTAIIECLKSFPGK